MLPALPKTRKTKEADFGIRFRKWLENNPRISGAFELKQCGTSFAFNDLKDHQVTALLLVKSNKGLLWKIADDSRGVKPFDMFYLRDAPAYVVIKFARSFSLIDIDTFLLEKKRSKRRSLTESRARDISNLTIDI